MKVVKPLKIGILHRTFELQGRQFWTPSVMAFFDFGKPAASLQSEIDMWKFTAGVLAKDAVLDAGMPKERAEILVSGDFCAPGDKPVPAGNVRLQAGRIDKTLFVFGHRYWRKKAGMNWAMSDPEPVMRMPVHYTHAFGGPDHKPNPLGKGMVSEQGPDGKQRIPLPNIELPDQLVVSRSDKPSPAGFGPIDPIWPPRAAKSGTYDQKWYETRFPGLADDIDWTFYNVAPDDQQWDGFFADDMRFSIEGMHPEKPTVSSALPDLRPRCFILRREAKSENFEEIDLRPDTLWLFPNDEKGILIYHGLTEVHSDTAKDIDNFLIAYEKRSHQRRAIAHYRQALDRRLDKEKGPLALLDERDLIAEGEKSGFAEMMEGEEVSRMQGDDLLKKKQKMRSDKDIEMIRDMIAGQGLDPDTVMPKPAADDLDMQNLDFDQILKDAELQKAEADRKLEEQLKALGMTRDQMLQDAAVKPAPRPYFSAEQAIATYKQMGIDSTQIEAKMKMVETSFNTTYRQVGHHLPPVLIEMAETDQQAKQQAVLEAHAQGKSLKGADLAGIDLAGHDLHGIDLEKAFLEDADLSGCNLQGANLSGTALMRTSLAGSNLSGACLKSAGLGKTNLSDADLSDADLTTAVLVGADLTQTRFVRSGLNDADLSEVKAAGADFTQATLHNVRCIEGDLSHIVAANADLSEALLYKTDLREADLTGAVLSQATLVEVNAAKTCCRQANLTNLRAAVGCAMAGMDFEGAVLTQTNLRGCCLSGASFKGADLSNCDLSDADLKGCDFSHAVARQTLFMEADLTGAKMAASNLYESLFHHAILFDTDFKGANLFGVDFMKARFRNTDMRLALLHKSTLNRWAPK